MSSLLFIVSVYSGLFLGCGGDTRPTDAGVTDADVTDADESDADSDLALGDLSISQVIPGRGPVDGGTVVTLLGAGFEESAVVTFGGAPATGVELDRASRIVCQTPAAEAPGPVDVEITSADGGSARLAEGFEYVDPENPPPDPTVDWCVLQWPPTSSVTVGEQTEQIFGRVHEAGVTDGEGQGRGVAAELGVGPVGSDPLGSDEWQWTVADFNVDVAIHDEFMARITVLEVGDYSYLYRFRLEGGPWTYCDLTGSDDGLDIGSAGELSVIP